MKARPMATVVVVSVAAILLASSLLLAHGGGPAGHAVTPLELAELLERDEAVVVDVRTPQEFRNGHIPGALNVPLSEVPSRGEEVLATARGRMVVLYCRSGRRAGIAEPILADHGVREIHHLTGQMSGWARAGLPVAQLD